MPEKNDENESSCICTGIEQRTIVERKQCNSSRKDGRRQARGEGEAGIGGYKGRENEGDEK